MARNKMKNESDVLKTFANEIAEKVSDQCISFLVDSTATLSGDDSGLVNVWEEICMQVQYDHSHFWDAYDETVQSLVNGYLTELKDHERYAIWFQTEAGWDWDYDYKHGKVQDNNPPVYNDDIISYITTEYIYRKALDYTNKNIISFIEGQYLD